MRPVFIGFGLASALLVACSSPAPAVTPAPAARPTVATAAQAAPTTAPAAAQAVAPAVAPATAPSAAAQTGGAAAVPAVVKVPVNATGTYDPATTLIMYGDIVLFAGGDNPENCTPKSRFKRGDPVGFRATAIDPATGTVADTAQLTVKLASGEALPMKYRGDGTASAHPGLWTTKWVVPDTTAPGVMHYTIEAKDSQGRSAVWAPFEIVPSILTIVQ